MTGKEFRARNNELTAATSQGRASCVRGLDACPPYDRDTPEYYAWQSGWAGAKALEKAFIDDQPEHRKEPA